MTNAQLTYKVEVDVSGGAFGAAFSATDVSSKAVAGLGFEPTTVAWGRQDQHSDVTPTAVDGALRNDDGTFTPGNSSSTYYPKIRRNLRRRVSVGVNSTTVHLSEDYATSIEVEPSRDGLPVTKVTGSDILARFGQSSSTQDVSALSVGTTLRSFIAEEMLVDSPSCLYMMQEAEGATSFADVTGVCSPLTRVDSKYGAGTLDAGQTPTGTFYGGTMVTFSSPDYGAGSNSSRGSWLAGTVPAQTTNFTYELWIQMPSAAPASGPALIFATSPTIQLSIDQSNGKLTYTAAGGMLPTSAALCDGRVHHVAIVNSSGTTSKLYVDGVQVDSATGTLVDPTTSISIGMTASSWGAGSSKPGLNGNLISPLDGSIAYFAVYPSALSAARVLAHYQAGATTFAGERTDQRITRLLSYRTNTGSSLDTGLGTMGVQDIQGRSLQDCLFEVAQAEAGVVFTDGVGQVNFRSRSRLFNPTAVLTLDVKAGGVDFGSNWREDTQNVVNDATVTNTSTGSAQRFLDSSSITTDGEYATNTSLPLNADTDAMNLAGWTVVNGTQRQLTATPLIVNLLHLTAAQAQAVLQLKPLDCITLTNCPTPAPSATETFIVQGGTISLAADAATATLNLTPLPYPVGVWDSTNWDAAGVTWAF